MIRQGQLMERPAPVAAVRGEGSLSETLFAFDRHDYHEFQNRFRGTLEQEYYSGSCWAEFSPDMSAHAARKRVGVTSIIRLEARCKTCFRRTRQDIRKDGLDMVVLFFVKQGHMEFTNQHGTVVVEAGSFLITRSSHPFFIECVPDNQGQNEVLHITVPAHTLRQLVHIDFGLSLHMPAGCTELGVAESLFENAFRNEYGLAAESAHVLVDAAFKLIGFAIQGELQEKPVRRTIVEKRLDDVLRFIEVHLADSALSVPMVSKGCGISPRYVTALLRMRETTFTELVWKMRLEKACDWLTNSDPRYISITEIAYGVGFKSPAHFSRMFKRVLGVNPKDYRQGSVQEALVLAS